MTGQKLDAEALRMMEEISLVLGREELLGQLSEECCELGQAAQAEGPQGDEGNNAGAPGRGPEYRREQTGSMVWAHGRERVIRLAVRLVGICEGYDPPVPQRESHAQRAARGRGGDIRCKAYAGRQCQAEGG